MVIGIISDIHGNAEALNAVLDELLAESVERVLCLGDVAGTGPEPIRTLERLQQLECPVVMGNVDEILLNPPTSTSLEDRSETDRMFAEIDEWCAGQLSSDHKEFIQSFKPTIEFVRSDGTNVFCYHGSPRSPSEDVRATTAENRLDELFEDLNADVLIGGHTHFPFIRRYNDSVIINPGSVGLPYIWNQELGEYYNPPWAEYATLSGRRNSLQIELRRCPLDVSSVVDAAFESEMPHTDLWTEGWQIGQ